MQELRYFKFEVPEARKLKTYAVKLADGRIVVRTEEELEELKGQEEKSGEEKGE